MTTLLQTPASKLASVRSYHFQMAVCNYRTLANHLAEPSWREMRAMWKAAEVVAVRWIARNL